MDHSITAIERAFQLAKSGICGSVLDIKRQLVSERYSIDQITGRMLSKQLDALIQTARKRVMPKGPKGEKRPADVIGNAIKIARIATGEEQDEKDDDGKDKAAVSLGRRGGKARAKSLTEGKRREIAKKAAAKRWAKE